MKLDKNVKQLKDKIISYLGEDDKNRKILLEKINELIKSKPNELVHSNLLELFVHVSFSEEEAKTHWDNIFKNYNLLNQSLDRNAGIRVAMFDYFINLNRILNEPILVEIMLFKETEKMAMIDALTGLFNRRYFDLSLNKELKRAKRHDSVLSLLIIDIDNFKKINDLKGHSFGDTVLKKFARTLQEQGREEDIICRYGGEEFIIILPETTGDGALKYAERLRHVIKNQKFIMENKITFSGGIACFPYDGRNASKLIITADKSLYAAKYAGKDCIIKSGTENRRYLRYNKSLKVLLKPIDIAFKSSSLKEVYTQEFSLGGMKFETNELIPIETKLLLNIMLPDNEEVVIVSTIVWLRKIEKDLYSYGVKFDDMRQDQLNKIRTNLPNNFSDERQG